MSFCSLESGLPFNIVGSYEINTTALEVYRHNFPKSPKAYNIMGLTLEQLVSLAPDIIMMSPPCQPFTRLDYVFVLLLTHKSLQMNPLLVMIFFLNKIVKNQYGVIENGIFFCFLS